jgi:hypothetical protein
VTVAGVVAVYCCAIAVAMVLTSFWAGRVRVFVVLVACSGMAVELTRRTGEPGRVGRDVYAIWDLPAAVLLPPLYALLVPIPRMILTQLRIRRTLLYRRAYTAAAVGLAYAPASMAFHAVAPVLGPSAGTGIGGPVMLWTLLTLGCGLLRLVVNDGLVLEQRDQLDRTLAEQNQQLDRTLAEQRTRTLNERFTTAAEQLGSDKPAVRLAGVYAMAAGLADDWEENRQTCVDVLCASCTSATQ